MRRILFVVLSLLAVTLTACESEKPEPAGIEEYSARVEKGIEEIGDPDFAYHEPVEEGMIPGSYWMTISSEESGSFVKGIMIKLDGQGGYLMAMDLSTAKAMGQSGLDNAVKLFAGSVDESLSSRERQKVVGGLDVDIASLGEEDVVSSAKQNGVSYIFSYEKQFQLITLKAKL